LLLLHIVEHMRVYMYGSICVYAYTDMLLIYAFTQFSYILTKGFEAKLTLENEKLMFNYVNILLDIFHCLRQVDSEIKG
jgi:hypothetical protein